MIILPSKQAQPTWLPLLWVFPPMWFFDFLLMSLESCPFLLNIHEQFDTYSILQDYSLFSKTLKFIRYSFDTERLFQRPQKMTVKIQYSFDIAKFD